MAPPTPDNPMAAGCCKDTVSLKHAYQQADAGTILCVVLNGCELRRCRHETVGSCTQHCTLLP